MLGLPDLTLPFSVDTGASKTQLGEALFQEFEDDGLRRPIGFWSHAFSETERNYSAMEREPIYSIWAVQILGPCLAYKKFD